MKTLCLILISLLATPVWAQSRSVVCQGPIKVQDNNKKIIDQGTARVSFQISDAALIKNPSIQTQFKKLKPQGLDGFEARAHKRALASGKFRADIFNIGENGACQMALGYQGDLIKLKKAQNSWGVLMLACGSYGVMSQIPCYMK